METTPTVEVQATWVPGAFHCPACGALILDEGLACAPQPCAHLLFLEITELGRVYEAPSLASAVAAAELEDCEALDEEFVALLPADAVVFRFDHTNAVDDDLDIVFGIRFPSGEMS